MEYPRGKRGPRCHMENKGDVSKWELLEEVETPLVCTNILLLLHDFLSKSHSIQQVPSSQGKSIQKQIPGELPRSLVQRKVKKKGRKEM